MNRRYTSAGANTNRQPSVWLTASRSRRGAVEATASTGTHHRRRTVRRWAGTYETSTGVLPCHPPQRARQTERCRPAPWA
jgi:hypothetical protein